MRRCKEKLVDESLPLLGSLAPYPLGAFALRFFLSRGGEKVSLVTSTPTLMGNYFFKAGESGKKTFTPKPSADALPAHTV